jgi:hypothetical protein
MKRSLSDVLNSNKENKNMIEKNIENEKVISQIDE